MPPPPASLPGLPDDYTSEFFRNDVVQSRTNAAFRAKVLRCWADEDGDMPPPPPGQEVHPLDRNLKRGEVGIADITNGELSIVPESSLTLSSRDFLKGDVVKRSLTSPESAVIVDMSTQVKLVHAITKAPVEDWVDYKLLKNSLSIEARDRVVYKGWIGTVEEVFEDGLIESQIGICYRLAEMGGLLDPGRKAADSIPKDAHGHLSNPFPPFASPSVDCIIDVRPIVIYVTWNAMNQQIPVSEQENYPEPKQFWYGKDIEELTHLDTFNLQPGFIGASVCFKDPADEKRYNFKPSTHAGGFEFNKLRIDQSRTVLTLRWQDGNETREVSTGFVPYRNIDDYETWPGEHLIWRGENDERRHAVTQSFDPHQRVAELLFPETNEKQLVPVLELDPGGRNGLAAYGVGFGQQVLLCEKNGSTPPEVPVLGQAETPVNNIVARHELARLADEYVASPDKFGYYLPKGDPKLVDWWGEVTQLHLDGSITVKLPSGDEKRVGIENVFLLNEPHGEMFEDEMAPGDGEEDDMIIDEIGALISGGKRRRSSDDAGSDASWETMDEDGQADGEEHREESSNQISVRPDSPWPGQSGDNADGVEDEHDSDRDSYEGMSTSEGEEERVDRMIAEHQAANPDPTLAITRSPSGTYYQDGIPVYFPGSEPFLTPEAYSKPPRHPDEYMLPIQEKQAQARARAPAQTGQSSPTNQPTATITGTTSVEVFQVEDEPGSAMAEAGPSKPTVQPNGHVAASADGKDKHGDKSALEDNAWNRFEMLEEAPEDHWFIKESSLQSTNKAYLSRLKKEHRALMTSLPDNIIVRTYEDRTDLMRVLIIGPEGTPYTDAPFVFDVYLNPTRFPNDPPLVHFHSHTNGHGRCNPNLYEEGKVCLSILGTWSGDASESWNPAKSSLLQVFVSISGLVLVRHPYHCEPAFAKLEGTKEGKVNSRLYSEKAYVLSRSFVRTSLDRPPTGLATEIRHYYITRGKLRSVISHASELIEKGQSDVESLTKEGEEMWNADAVGSLTMGAIITLKRTITALEKIAEREGV
ncbi:hypothetical protein I316_05840 [Kwoniella heveanensis BCC8398]|uniref:UBC core domain-containing protein n=1 Tax=Kwoniella heveanensis BCC8398 TaxID=1296120 RepID=A0A1B9GNI9_9TREE|nr:hypothetical protein I316_05840 [Kwoniella heveanensis BCC8398]